MSGGWGNPKQNSRLGFRATRSSSLRGASRGRPSGCGRTAVGVNGVGVGLGPIGLRVKAAGRNRCRFPWQ
eukprot:11175377-Alexandrium_andersonii.AAC.1